MTEFLLPVLRWCLVIIPMMMSMSIAETSYTNAKTSSSAEAPANAMATYAGASVVPASLSPIHRIYRVVKDLDWTLFYNIPDPRLVPPGELLVFEGEKGLEFYRASDHLPEFIEALLRLPGMKISFFSGGGRERNEALLRRIRLSDGRTALDVAERVFSKPDLTQVSNDESLRFPQRYKKRPQDLFENIDMTRMVLFDDHPEFADGELRVVLAHGVFEYNPEFDPAKIGQPWQPRSLEQFQKERDKLALAYGVIEAAWLADQEGRGEFATIAENLMKDPKSGQWLPLDSPLLEPFFERGRAVFKEIRMRTRSGDSGRSRKAEKMCRAIFN